MNDYFKCAKNNSSSKSNRKLLTFKAKSMVLKLSWWSPSQTFSCALLQS